jgi:23S rRNA (adenine2030-N6)-methyltransferase
MNYRHIYHAGNFADVFKHCVLIVLAQSLLKKTGPILFLETHAGIGKYDLTSAVAQKTREYENGATRIYNLHNNLPTIKTYQNIIHIINAHTKTLHFYPGSPLIIRYLMRTQDYMALIELHQEDIKLLKRCFYQDQQVAVHLANGYHSLKAFLPPKHGRSLILIDPPFEEKNEFEQIITGLQIALKRFSNGVYMIWYPIKNTSKTKDFYKKLKTIECKNILAIELTISKTVVNSGLNSCGLIIINIPWQLELKLKPVISWLSRTLALDPTGEYKIKWLIS